MFIHSRRAGEKEAGGRDLGVEESEEEGQIYYLKENHSHPWIFIL